MKLNQGVLWSANAALSRQLQSPNGGLFLKSRSGSDDKQNLNSFEFVDDFEQRIYQKL